MPVQHTCQHCGDKFEAKPSHERKYCSKPCFYEGRKSENRVTRTCNHCGEEFEVVKSRLDYGRGKHCSKECQYAAIRGRPPRSDYEEFECLNCSEPFYLTKSKSEAKNGAGKYCSRECRDEHWKGENHPQYRGKRPDRYKGPHWQSIRREVREKADRTCQNCGCDGKQVHHIKPRRFFGEPSDSNFEENLIVLCSACHRKADAAVQRLEKVCNVCDMTPKQIRQLTIERPSEPTIFNQRTLQ